MNKYAILIGIAGGTGSGKTSVAKAIAADFGKSADFSFEICRFACGTFLDRSRWVLGVGSSYLSDCC